MLTYALVAIGSALGGMARYAVGIAAMRHLGEDFPYGTLIVNILGSIIIGFAAAAAIGDEARTFVTAGLCGGFTTFSSFSLQTMVLIRERRWGRATLNILSSVGLCLGGVLLGHAAAHWVAGAALLPVPLVWDGAHFFSASGNRIRATAFVKAVPLGASGAEGRDEIKVVVLGSGARRGMPQGLAKPSAL
jgi:CrcB protein